MTDQKNANWGGKRAGAGRKKSAIPKIVWTVKVTEEEREYLKDVLTERRAKQPKPISYSQLFDAFVNAHERGEVMEGVIVYSEDNFNAAYTLDARSYKITSDNNAFDTSKTGSSLFGDSLDGSDKRVRLDQYDWDIEYCYIIE